MRLRPAPAVALIAALSAAALSGCSQFPELEEVEDSAARNAPYPDLVPIESIKATVPDAQTTPETAPDLETRVDSLKARAGRLKGAVVDGATQERMQAGVN